MNAWIHLLALRERPTLPFLVGALHELDDPLVTSIGDALGQVRALLQEMANQPVRLSGQDWVVYIDYCNELEVPVFHLRYRELLYSCRCRLPDGAGLKDARLYLSDEIEAGPASFEEVVNRLFRGYGHSEAIRGCRYSRDKLTKTWRPFDEEDLRKIESVRMTARA